MKIAIDRIAVTERIRKEIAHIPELAADIQKNGLINPVTVMETGDGEFRLLAGLRRIRAAQALGWTELEAHAFAPADAEAALRIEISENEQREPFTLIEKVNFGRLLEEIETAKAKARMVAGRKDTDPVPHGTQGNGRTRKIVGSKVGMSGTQYDRAKFIAANAPPEMIDQLDRGERTIRGAYDELRAQKNTAVASAPEASVSASKPSASPAGKKGSALNANLSKSDLEAIQKLQNYDALPPEGKIAELQRQLKEERARAAHAESELSRLQELNHNDVSHKDSIIESLKRQVSELNAALETARARIQELERLA